MSEGEYPECEKMAKVKDRSQIIGEFLEWLEDEKGYGLAYYDSLGLCPVHKSKEELLAEFFQIDLKKVEKEKRHMVEVLRIASKKLTEG